MICSTIRKLHYFLSTEFVAYKLYLQIRPLQIIIKYHVRRYFHEKSQIKRFCPTSNLVHISRPYVMTHSLSGFKFRATIVRRSPCVFHGEKTEKTGTELILSRTLYLLMCVNEKGRKLSQNLGSLPLNKLSIFLVKFFSIDHLF